MPNHSFAVIDLETTGFVNRDRVLEIGVVQLDPTGAVEGRWRTLVQPDRAIDNSSVHGVTPSDLVDAPSFADIAGRLADVIRGRVLVAHNASFERRFLTVEFGRLGVDLKGSDWILDTLPLARRMCPGPSFRLGECLRSAGIENVSAHTALADADATAQLFRVWFPDLADEIGVCRPLEFDDFSLSLLPRSELPLLPRDDGLFPDAFPIGKSPEASSIEMMLREELEWLRRITDSAPGVLDDAADRYFGLLADSLVDGELDADEVARLLDIAHTHGLTDDDVDDLHELYIRQLVVEAWADGVITPNEQAIIVHIARQLAIDPGTVAELLVESRPETVPVMTSPAVDGSGGDAEESEEAEDAEDAEDRGDETPPKVRLRTGDRVTFTGSMANPREDWESRAAAAGLDVGGVCGKSVVLVAADVHSRSGKAKKARSLGIPIITETEFAACLAALHAVEEVAAPASVNAGEDAAGEVPAAPEPQGRVLASGAPGAGRTTTAEEFEEEGGELRLTEIFPWIGDVPVTDPDATGVVEAWLESRADVPLHAMSPVLEPETHPEGLDTTHRTVGAWFGSYPQPLLATVEDLSDIQGVGRVRLRSFVYATVLQAIDDAADVADRAKEAPLDTVTGDVPGAESRALKDGGASMDYFDLGESVYSGHGPLEPGELTPADIVTGWLALIGAWPYAGVGMPTVAASGIDVPATVAEAAGEMTDPAMRVIEHALRDFDDVAAGEGPRASAIIDHRMIGGRTLGELGEDFGITRERVRQIETVVKRRLGDMGMGVRLLKSAVAARFGPVRRISDVRALMPELDSTPTSSVSPLWELLAISQVPTLGDGDVAEGRPDDWRIADGWLLVVGAPERIEAEVRRGADRYGVGSLSEMALALGLDESVLGDWLVSHGGAHVDGDVVLTANGSIPERAAAILSIGGEPMTTDEIHAKIPDRSRTSITNALSISALMHRCATDTWALAEWGMEEWTTIVDFIHRRIDASPEGRVPLTDLLGEAANFKVSENSVYTFANTPEFSVVDGMVSKADASEAPVNEALPEETRDLYWRDGEHRLLVTVTRDHLRGSGSGVGAGVAALYGIAFLESRELPSRLGPQRLTWGRTNASIGTVGRFMDDLGVFEGDRVWMIFRPDEFDVVVATPRRDGLQGVAKLLNDTGLDDAFPDDAPIDEVLRAFNEAIGLEPDAPRRRTVSRLRYRGDDALAELIREL